MVIITIIKDSLTVVVGVAAVTQEYSSQGLIY